MALYSFHGQIIGRGKSIRMNKDGSVAEKADRRRSTSVAAAAYRAGTRLVDTRTGVVYDYTRKGGVVHTEILLPPNAPGRYNDRQTLWNAVEQAERQNNVQLSRELRIAARVQQAQRKTIGNRSGNYSVDNKKNGRQPLWVDLPLMFIPLSLFAHIIGGSRPFARMMQRTHHGLMSIAYALC